MLPRSQAFGRLCADRTPRQIPRRTGLHHDPAPRSSSPWSRCATASLPAARDKFEQADARSGLALNPAMVASSHGPTSHGSDSSTSGPIPGPFDGLLCALPEPADCTLARPGAEDITGPCPSGDSCPRRRPTHHPAHLGSALRFVGWLGPPRIYACAARRHRDGLELADHPTSSTCTPARGAFLPHTS